MSEHITGLIEETPLTSLSESDLTAIRTHVRDCADCARTFEAAQISVLMLQERVAKVFEPSPFFHTRVLATLRERQSANEGWAWSSLWRSASALAYSMVAAVALLAAVSFAIPATQGTSGFQELTSAYAADAVILNQGELLDDQVSDGQILATLYSGEEEAAR